MSSNLFVFVLTDADRQRETEALPIVLLEQCGILTWKMKDNLKYKHTDKEHNVVHLLL